MSGLVEKADHGLKGLTITGPMGQAIRSMQPQGPLPYVTLDVMNHFAWLLAVLKFLASIFALPLMVVLRKDLGVRTLDEIHIFLSFVAWQTIGMLALDDRLVGEMASPLISVWGWIFLPIALWHRRSAWKAALRRERYSYYPGTPRLARACLAIRTVGFRSLDGIGRRLLGRRFLPGWLVRPEESQTPFATDGWVRRYVEPLLVIFVAVIGHLLGAGKGFSFFLSWTALLLFVNESLSQRAYRELYLNEVDSLMMSREKQAMLSDNGPLQSQTHGFALASRATTSSSNHV